MIKSLFALTAGLAMGISTNASAAPNAVGELPRRSSLGVALGPSAKGANGALVQSVLPGTTGQKIGILAQDVIVRAGGRAVPDVPSAIGYASQLKAGQKVDLVVVRGGKERRLSGLALGQPLETYAGATVDYGAVRFRDGYLRDIMAVPNGVQDPPVVFLLPGFSCVSIESPLPSHPYRRLGESLLKAGVAYYRAEKPGMGDSIGSSRCTAIDYATELDGFRAAYQHLVKVRGISPDRIFMFGHSLGGLEAPMLAAEVPPRGIAVYGTVYRNWADYHLNVGAFQSFLMNGEDPVAAAQHTDQIRDLFRRYYFDRKSPAEIAAEVPGLADPMRGIISWNGADMVMGRNYKFMQDLAHLPLAAAWRDSKSNVLSLYGESDLVALFDEDHRLIADVVNHYRPGTGHFVEVAGTDHGMELVGSRDEVRRRGAAGGPEKPAAFNPEVGRIVAEWIRDSMATPPVRTLAEPAPRSPSAG
jgi:pimeloyl-ACP methyl ester carboxylesterase